MKLTFGNETPGGVEDSEWQGFILWFQAFEKSESVSVFAIIEGSLSDDLSVELLPIC